MEYSLLLEAFIRVSRMFACATGGLVLFDSIGTLIYPRELPPHNIRKNAIAWSLASGPTMFLGLLLISLGFNIVDQGATDDRGRVIVGCLWLSWGIAFTYRASIRAFRPHFIVWSAVFMLFGGFLLALFNPTI